MLAQYKENFALENATFKNLAAMLVCSKLPKSCFTDIMSGAKSKVSQ